MKKYTYSSRRFSLRLIVTLLGVYFLFFKSLGYSDDSLSSLQQEVIYAKEKQRMIAQKSASITVAVDPEQNKPLENQADSLMKELIQRNYSFMGGQPERAEVLEKSARYVQIQPKKTKKTEKQKKPDPFSKMADGMKKVLLSPWPEYKEPKLAEGEALYKVAVSDRVVTMREAAEIGLANSIQLLALKKKIEVAEAKLVEAKRALFPTFQAALEENGGKLGGSDDNPSGRIYRGRNYKVNVSQPVFYGGELELTVKQAELNLESSKKEYDKAKNELILQLKTAYYGVVKAEYNVQYQAELYNEFSSMRKQSREGFEKKVMAEVDYLNIESKFQESFFQAESAKNDLLSAYILLRQTMNLDAAYALPLDLKLKFKKVSVRFEDMIAIAMDNSADLKIKALAVRSAEYGVKVYRAKKLPRVDLRGSYGILGEIFKDTEAIEDDNHDLDLEKEWFVGVTASMPLGPNSLEYNQIKHKYGPTVLALHGSEDWSRKLAFNLFDKLSDITDEKSAIATLLQSQADYEKSKDDLTIKVKDDFYNLQKSLIQIDASLAKIRYQQKQNDIWKYLVKLQERELKDWLDGLLELSQAKFSFIQAVTDYDLAVSSLAASIGDPDYFEN